MPSPPWISLVMPSFNQADFLEEAILSVLQQDYPRLEFIVIDGGSTDGSRAIIERHAGSLHYWCCEPDRGQSNAINKGFSHATGDILCWLNSDDLLLPGALQSVAERLGTNRDPAWMIGCAQVVDQQGRTRFRRCVEQVDENTFARWSHAWFPQQATFWNRAMWESAGPLDEHLHYTMDLALWMRMYDIAPPLIVDDALAAYRMHDQAKCVADEDRAAAERRALLRQRLDLRLRRISDSQGSEAALAAFADEYFRLQTENARLEGQLQRLLGHVAIGRIARWWKRFINPGLDI